MVKIDRLGWRHILVWLAVFIFIFSMASYFQPVAKAFTVASLEVGYLMIIYLVSYFYIFPVHYRNTLYYFIVSMVFILVFAILYLLIEVNFVEREYQRRGFDAPVIFPFMKFIISNSFIHFIATSLRLMERTTKLVKTEKLLREEKLETELKLLKAQIDPHFIFNALNNIYSLTYMRSKSAPESILKLSDMLRYVFYDCSRDRVPMRSELKYIENFTAFQQMKSEFPQNINLNIDKNLNGIEIAPMLFIPFIENAFKYSRIEEDQEAFVKIELKSDGQSILFRVENSFNPNDLPLSGSGVGIENVRYRLGIIYPDEHQLEIKKYDQLFVVELAIQTEEK